MSKVILFNKPYGVLTQFTDQHKRETLAKYIPIPHVYPAGRLDKDSEGLIILTDDGQLQHLISDPKNKLLKTYWVQVEGTPTEVALNPLRQGIKLKEGKTRPAQVNIIAPPNIEERNPPIRYRPNIPTTWLEIKIVEGKNRQVRRMTAAIGYPTLRLIRVAIGQWTIGRLKPGEYKITSIDPKPR